VSVWTFEGVSVVVQVPLLLPSDLVQVVTSVFPQVVIATCDVEETGGLIFEVTLVVGAEAIALHLLLLVQDLVVTTLSAVVRAGVVVAVFVEVVTGLSVKQEPLAVLDAAKATE
jgi:hypothetical protein